MAEKINVLQQALKQISDAKRQLCRNTAEAKSRIQCNISRQLEALRNREVWLLNQLDVVSSAKEEVLQQQSARLNQTLGILQSSVQYPGSYGDKIKGIDVENIRPEETPFVSFKSDVGSLREAIMNYGRIDPNSVPPLQSPFLASDEPAPSLPKQFEDYNDAEHHILYKTVEEINWKKNNEPCVQVNIPKLSGRIDDWLLYPSTGSAVSLDPLITFPKLSNNLSDWLRAPIPVHLVCKEGTPALSSDGVAPLEGMSADASIKTWLHKIKQFPYEEEEEGYDFVEEISDVRTRSICDFPCENINFPEEKQPDIKICGAAISSQIKSLPMDSWLLQPECIERTSKSPSSLDMSHFLKSVTEELDKWLLHRVRRTVDSGMEDSCSSDGSFRLKAPSSPKSQWSSGSNHLSRIDEPWLQQSPTVRRFHQLESPISSRSSSFSCISRQSSYDKWLLGGGVTDDICSSKAYCSFMEKYKKEVANFSWLKSDKRSCPLINENPMACFEKKEDDCSYWLKLSSSTDESVIDIKSPMENALEFQYFADQSTWLLNAANKSLHPNSCFKKEEDINEDGLWLFKSTSCFKHDLPKETC